jgi:hypothetical protein
MTMRKRTRRLFMVLGIGLGILMAACTPQTKPTPDQQDQEIRATVEALDAKRQAREKELAAMDVPQLVEELQQESERGVEPFNSMPFDEIVTRGREAAPELFKLLEAPDRRSILGLLALRQIDKDLYGELDPAFRVEVLVDTLRTSQTFNIWGLPHLYWEDAARALIGEGRQALDALRPLLEDHRPAPMWGSEEVLESQAYSYRVSDYAWAISMSILGEEVRIPMSPEERDKLIGEMINR